jgi:hypothetical protein
MYQYSVRKVGSSAFQLWRKQAGFGPSRLLNSSPKQIHQRLQLTGPVKIKFPDYQFDKTHPPTASHDKPSIIREFHGDVSEVTTWKVSNLTAVVARMIIVSIPCSYDGELGAFIACAAIDEELDVAAPK